MIPAGGAHEPSLDALTDWVQVQGEGSTAKTWMQRGAFNRFWGPEKRFVIVKVFPEVPEGG